MRIWSLHPKYLDSKGLVALWRETLLAKHVLDGKTVGYKNHPQLDRFKQAENSLDCINLYLSMVYDEASSRGYNFNEHKFDRDFRPCTIKVTSGQMEFERTHLLRKLKIRDVKKFQAFMKTSFIEPHPLFKIVDGAIEKWEIIEPDSHQK